MAIKINSSKVSNSAQSTVPEQSTKKRMNIGRLKHFGIKIVEKCKNLLIKVGVNASSNLAKDVESTAFKGARPINDDAKQPSLYSYSDNREGMGVACLDVSEMLRKRPTTDNEREHLLRMLESKRDSLIKESSGKHLAVIQQIDNRVSVLRERLISSSSSYNEFRLKQLKTEAALDLIIEKCAHLDELKAELTSRIKSLDRAALQESKMNHLAKDQLTSLSNYSKILLKKIEKTGLKVTAHELKECVTDRLNREEWHEINKVGSIITNGQEYRFKQQCTPACMMTEGSATTSKDGSDAKEEAVNIFSEDYHGKGVTAHAIKNTKHATNLFTSRLINQDTNQEDIAMVRHGTNSPYGLKPGKERTEGALNRSKEVVISALTLKPELLEMACQGKSVNLMLTSTSLLTPDPFRKILRPAEDEKAMLEDQLAAYRTLCKSNPVALMIKTASGEMKEIRVNLELVPFNFGVNAYAVDTISDKVGGWAYADSINDEGFQRLLGSTDPNASIGGIVGKWLSENKDHPDIEVVNTLVKHLREIYSSHSHRTLKGGAYKLTSRLMVLTGLIGGVPCTNCKSGKDRTGMSVVTTEALITHIRMYGEVPSWHEVSEDHSHLIKEFCFQGVHHEIQRLNAGVAGFKIDPPVLKEYGMNEDEMTKVKGLANMV